MMKCFNNENSSAGTRSLAAICVRRNNVDSMYYVHPDRLGSYTHITDSSKQVIRALHFDPWGNVKADANWLTFDSTTLSGNLAGTFRFFRGFTGHEHYADLKIINMKAPSKREQKQACLIFVEREVLRDEVSTFGRLYDPVIARFFSPRQLRAGTGVHAELQQVFVLSEQPVCPCGTWQPPGVAVLLGFGPWRGYHKAPGPRRSFRFPANC